MVSVLINNHNYGQYIGEAINSVLNQTYRDFELIIVDGDSSDDSREVIMSYVKKYPQIITAVFKPSSGQAAAFNVGFKLSRGDIIAFLDSDDFFYPDKLEKIVKLHETNEFVGHARKVLNKNGRLHSAVAMMDDFDSRPLLFHEYGHIYTYNLIASCISVRRDLLEKILPMPEEGYVTFADCYVKVMAQYYCNIKYVEDELAYYRIHDAQKVNSFDDGKKMNLFLEDLYGRIFRDINKVLNERGERKIPEPTPERLKKAFSIANPDVNIKENGKYVLYGVGKNSYKIRSYVELLGGEFLYVADSDESRWGKVWDDLNIISPGELLSRRCEYAKVIIGSTYYYREIEEKLAGMGMNRGMDYVTIRSIPND